MAFLKEIKSAGKSEYGIGVLYAGVLGLILSDAIPTVADYFYFRDERKLRNKFIAGEITSKEYWTKTAENYYLYNVGYWLVVGGIIVSIKGDVKRKLNVGLGIIGAGAVLGIIANNIRKDEQEKDLLEQKEIAKLKKSGKL